MKAAGADAGFVLTSPTKVSLGSAKLLMWSSIFTSTQQVLIKLVCVVPADTVQLGELVEMGEFSTYFQGI